MLGNGEYGVTLAEWGGRIVWQSTDTRFTSLTFSREAEATSKASLSAVMRPEVADRIEPWVHLLTAYRDGELVWHGYVTKVSVSANGVTVVEAADASVMFGRRRVPLNRDWKQHDATQVMRTHVEDSVGFMDGAQLVENITERQSRVWVTESWVAAECMLDDVVGELVKQGLVWTVSAGRLLIGPVSAERTTQQISDQYFDGEVKIVKDGSEVVTDSLVTGQGVWGVQTLENSPYGLHQEIESASGNISEGDCVQVARRNVEARHIAPRRVEVGGGSRLLPTAPISFDELVPGVRIPVASAQTGVLVASVMQLTKLDVTVDDSGESVSITLDDPYGEADPDSHPDPALIDRRSPYQKEAASQMSTAGSGGRGQDDDEQITTPPV